MAPGEEEVISGIADAVIAPRLTNKSVAVLPASVVDGVIINLAVGVSLIVSWPAPIPI